MKIVTLVLLSIILFSCKRKKETDRKAQLAGMYKLYIAENADSNGVWHEDPWTKGGTGYIVYDGLGHMAVHITRKGYNDYNWLPEEQSLRDEYINQKLDSMSTDELKDAVRAFASSYVYAGNYNIEDTADIVQHHRISTSIHSPVGSTVRRAYSFSGDTIILHVLNGNRRLKWIKQP
ncbi:MAG TPA: lipocalin-like domain-containing protein [Chitinophagaceae bacterium]|nr:lipocalin-like domain-containing protein [Chitinophagaceae bacterium]